MNKDRDVIIFLESPWEKMEHVNRGLLTEGGRIARHLGGNLSAMSAGIPAEKTTLLEEYGVSVLYDLTGKDLSEYNGETFALTVKEALSGLSFRLLLFAHTNVGAELAPCVASHLGTSAVMECINILLREQGLSYTRLVHGGQFEQEVSYRGSCREIVTIKPDVMNTGSDATASSLCIVQIPVNTLPVKVRTKSLELIPPDNKTVDIRYAGMIIGVGSGCLGSLGLIEELSSLLNSVIGTTRPVVDDGYIPKKRLIGRTGKSVSPDLYFALGISGSQHHVAGIQQAKEILSVNLDPRAPIFSFSDAGFVADLNKLLPKLIERIKRYRDEGVA